MLSKFLNLSPRIRLLTGLGVMAYASIAMYATDRVSPSLGFDASEQEREEVRSWMPRVRAVERHGKENAGKEGG